MFHFEGRDNTRRMTAVEFLADEHGEGLLFRGHDHRERSIILRPMAATHYAIPFGANIDMSDPDALARYRDDEIITNQGEVFDLTFNINPAVLALTNGSLH